MGNFSVQLLRQGLAVPTADEASAMGLRRGRLVWVREVTLFCDRQPLVFAHSVLPQRPRGPMTGWLKRMGERSLGALLFSHHGFQRSPIEFRRLDRRHRLFQPAVAALASPTNTPMTLWSRRSRFTFGKQNILVTEIFSPELARHPKYHAAPRK